MGEKRACPGFPAKEGMPLLPARAVQIVASLGFDVIEVMLRNISNVIVFKRVI